MNADARLPLAAPLQDAACGASRDLERHSFSKVQMRYKGSVKTFDDLHNGSSSADETQHSAPVPLMQGMVNSSASTDDLTSSLRQHMREMDRNDLKTLYKSQSLFQSKEARPGHDGTMDMNAE